MGFQRLVAIHCFLVPYKNIITPAMGKSNINFLFVFLWLVWYNSFVMKAQNFSFRCIAYQEKDSSFSGICLDLDIVEEGHASLQEAILSIHDAIESHTQAAAKLGYPKELMTRPAPKEYWDKLDALVHAKPQKLDSLPFQFFTTNSHLSSPSYV